MEVFNGTIYIYVASYNSDVMSSERLDVAMAIISDVHHASSVVLMPDH